MKKFALIGGLISVAIAISVGVIYSLNTDFSTESNMQRKYGTVDTTMGSPLMGSSSAPVTIIEFGDYQCPQCDKWFKTVRPDIEEHYIKTGKASLFFVDLAFFGPDSKKAAEATYCAGDQGKYWDYHNTLYSNQQGINDGWASPDNLKKFASELNLDRELFDVCLDSDKYQKRVERNILEAKRNGVSGTPTFMIVGSDGSQQRIEGAQPFSVFRQVLDSMV
ncbi:MAG TPA: DsbA family protein [Candidatus Nitrosotenuis sp.]|nr:DsbA family protein [Candidatus Nitrosotenuis sp.]